jgi:hypothetical protein
MPDALFKEFVPDRLGTLPELRAGDGRKGDSYLTKHDFFAIKSLMQIRESVFISP